jgi:hypothetical protein
MAEICISLEALSILRLRSRRPLTGVANIGDGMYLVKIEDEDYRLIEQVAFDDETANDVIIRMHGIRHGYN